MWTFKSYIESAIFMWLIGDYILAVSMTLNGSMALAYAYEGNYPKACYWLSALGINFSLLWMK